MPEALGGTKRPSGCPRMPQDGPQIRVFMCLPCEWQSLRCHHTCFYVSAVVSTSFGAVGRHGYFLHAGGLLARSYVKIRAASEGAETASVKRATLSRSRESSLSSTASRLGSGTPWCCEAARRIPDASRHPPRCLNSAEIHGEARQTWRMLEYME